MEPDPCLSLKESEITLSRGESGLGFNIRGGVDNPHIPGDTGIFVTRIRENGAANKDGRLKEGDKILEINGKSLVNVTHDEAVNCFTQAKEEVQMKVQHGAQDAILEKKRRQRMEEDAKKTAARSWLQPALIGAGVVVAAISVLGIIIYKKQWHLRR